MRQQEELKTIGDTLKARRGELNLSLKEAENATSIRHAHLQAIEEGEMSKLISPVYAQGFIKQYAAFLGMDGESLVREHPDLFVPRQSSSNEFSYGIGTLEMRNTPGSNVKWMPNLTWVVGLGAILALAWLCARYLEVI